MTTLGLSPAQPMTSPQEENSNVLRGSSALGMGVDVFGEYATGNSLKQQVLELDPYTRTDPVSGKLTSEHIKVNPAQEGMASSIEGSTVREVASSVAASANLSGSYGFFKGEMSVSYDSASTSKTSTRFVQYSAKLYHWRLTLSSKVAPQSLMSEYTRELFESEEAMSAADLIRRFGTHYIGAATVGGRLTYCCSIDTSDFASNSSLKAAAEASFKGLVGKADASVSAEVKEAASMITSKATKQVRVLGGTNTETLKILNGSSFDNWASSVEGNMHVVDLTNGLMPITDLIVDRTRRERVAQELRAVMESTDGIPLPYLKPVQAYHNGKSKSWFFSPRQDDIPTGFGPSSYEGTRFFVYEEKRGEAVQFYRMQAGEKPLYMLTPDPTPRNGWVDPVPVFYAYRSDGPNRVPVYSYQNTETPEKYGWFYNTKQKVHAWSKTSENSFFAPIA